MLTIGLSIRAFARGLLGPGTDAMVIAVSHRIDINHASVHELQLLPGFGPTRAESVVLERVRHGPFLDLDQLQRVDGIGPATVRAIEPFVRCVADAARVGN